MKAWQNLSVSKKLYLIVGIMAILVTGELLSIRFAMNTLSALRAFVGGEGIWSKAQKNAVLSLHYYALTRDEKDYQDFLKYLKIPESNQSARIEFEKKDPSLKMIREGLSDGVLHSDDVDSVVNVVLSFRKNRYLEHSFLIWGKADLLLNELKAVGVNFHQLVLDRSANLKQMGEALKKVRHLNEELTQLEHEFSSTLGMVARDLESSVLTLLFAAVFVAESVGIALTFITSRSILRRLRAASEAAFRVSQGDFSQPIQIESNDEFAKVARAFNEMSRTIQESQERLEQKVSERTLALECLLQENSKLYEKVKSALQSRDEFLSIASHELRTPITSLVLQFQMTRRLLKEHRVACRLKENERLERLMELSDQQVNRMVYLVEQLLDVSKIKNGKLNLHFCKGDLSDLVLRVCEIFEQTLKEAGCELRLNIASGVVVQWLSI
jgi:signal transduction histidine kinase